MNVEIGTVAAQFLFWEYLFRIFHIVSLQCSSQLHVRDSFVIFHLWSCSCNLGIFRVLWFPLILCEQAFQPTNLVIGNLWASRASYLSVLHEKRKVFVSYSTLSGEGKCWQYRSCLCSLFSTLIKPIYWPYTASVPPQADPCDNLRVLN